MLRVVVWHLMLLVPLWHLIQAALQIESARVVQGRSGASQTLVLARLAAADAGHGADDRADGWGAGEVVELQLVVNVRGAVATPLTHVNSLVRVLEMHNALVTS